LQPKAGGDAARSSQVAMPRISRLDSSQVSPEVASIFDHFMKVRGNVPNMFRTVAHRPELLKTMIAHFAR